MPDIQGFQVGSTTYQYDYRYLTHSPIPSSSASDEGKSLIVNSTGDLEWGGVIPRGDTPGYVLTTASSYGDMTWRDPGLYVPYPNGSDVALMYTGSTVLWTQLIPDVSNANSGDVLKFTSNTGLMWDTVFPSNANNGEFLKYTSNTGLVWDEVIPSPSSASDGDILIHTSNTAMMWDSVQNILDTNNASDHDVLIYSSNSGLIWDTVIPNTYDAIENDVLMWSSNNGLFWGSDLVPSDGSTLMYVGSNYGIQWQLLIPTYDKANTHYDDGKILMVSGNTLVWNNVVPAHSSSDAGKVLTVASNGALKWELPT